MVALLTLALMGQLVIDDSDRPPPLLRRALDPWGGYFSALTPDRPPDVCGCAALTARDGTPLTFVRGTAATCERKGFATTGLAVGDLVTCASGMPRVIPHSVTGAPSVLMEWAADNYALRSEEITNGSVWSITSAGVAAAVPYADVTEGLFGATTADRLVVPATTSGQYSYIYQGGFPAAQSVDSVYLRGNGTTGTINLLNGSAPNACKLCSYNPTTWTRCELATSGAASTFVFLGNDSNSGPCGTASRAAQDVFVWGFQHELGDFATSYIPTTSAIASRAAEQGQFNRSYPTTTAGLCTAATIEFRNLTSLVGGAGLWAPQLSSTVATSVGAPYFWPYTISAGSNIGIDATGAASPAGFSSSAVDPLTGANRYVAGHNGSALAVCRNGTCTVNGVGSTWSATTFVSLRLNVNNALKQAAAWSNIQFDPTFTRCTQ